MKLGGEDRVMVGAQNVWIIGKAVNAWDEQVVAKFRGRKDHGSWFNFWQAAAGVGGTTRDAARLTASFSSTAEFHISLIWGVFFPLGRKLQEVRKGQVSLRHKQNIHIFVFHPEK